jgi:O-antigen ligase
LNATLLPCNEVLLMLEIDRATDSSDRARVGFVKVLVFLGLMGLVLMISFFSPYLGATALGLLLAGLLLGVNLRLATLGLVFLLPFDPQLEVKPGFYLYLDLFFIVPALIYLWKTAFANLRIHWASLALGPYVLFAIATSFWRADNLYWFSGYSVRLVIAVLFMAVVAGIVQAKTITLALGATLIPQVVYGVYQLLLGDLGAVYWLIYPHYEKQPLIDRAYGFFFQPNNFGGYCAVVSAMLLALALRSKAHRQRILCCVLATFGFVGVACSGSRGAWLGAAASLAVLFLYSRASFAARIALVTFIAVVILLATSMEFAPLTRSATIDTFTVETRSTAYLAGILLFLQNPLTGVGLTNYQVLMPSVVEWAYDPVAAHNTYLQLLSENGIIGFLLFMGPVFYFFYRNLKMAKESTTALLSSAGMTVFLVHGLFDFQLSTAPQYLLLFAILFGFASVAVVAPATGKEVEG